MLSNYYSPYSEIALYLGSCQDMLKTVKQSGDKARLIVTSPPYNIGKSYEQKQPMESYLAEMQGIIDSCVDVLADNGSICWQVGHNIQGKGRSKELFPLDILFYDLFKKHDLKLKNRIIWTFGFGMHDKLRFSGRHETILWFVKSDNYVFNLDPVRVPQKFPLKRYFRGKRAGELSCNPLGKNPGDVWDIVNVKNGHPEKTAHPCQFPTELVRRLVLSLTNPGDLVIDPFMGSGTTAEVCYKLGRRVAGAENNFEYYNISAKRLLTLYENGSRL
jgi:adenine-specific DNA-methyltransferase